MKAVMKIVEISIKLQNNNNKQIDKLGFKQIIHKMGKNVYHL